MQPIISKELLSEVLVEDINDIVNDKTTPKNLFQYEIKKIMLDGSNVAYREINIHELAFKCKEWALRNNFCIISATFTSEEDDIEENLIKDVNYAWAELHNEDKLFRADTEPKAIFKACQWILDNKDK